MDGPWERIGVESAIRDDIQRDGHLPKETARGYRGIHYQNFALDALFFLSEMAYKLGVDIYSYEPNDRSLNSQLTTC